MVPRTMTRGVYSAALAAVLMTGAAGLLYQVAWTRRLSSTASGSVGAQALVLAVFMLGLGLGAYVAGRNTARIERPARRFALCELSAAALALVGVKLIGSTPFGGLALPAQLTIASLLMLSVTTLLGMSLPLFIEALERLGARRAGAIGALYGFNTLGAALGATVGGFYAIEAIGLTMTVAAGALCAAIGALVAAVAIPSAAPPKTSERVEGRVEPVIIGASLLTGLVAVGAEVWWTRLVALVLMNTVYAFTQVLIAVLLGVAIGGALTAIIPKERLRLAAGALAAIACVLMALIPRALIALGRSPERIAALSSGLDPGATFLLMAALVPPAAALAAVLPLLAASTAATRGSTAFGVLYGANTLGAVLGSASVGFILLPRLGAQLTGATLMSLATVAALLTTTSAAASESSPRRTRLAIGAAFALAMAIAASSEIPDDVYRSRVPDYVKILEIAEGHVSDVMVSEDNFGSRRLWINGYWVARAEAKRRPGLRRDHAALGHVPMLLVDEPKRVVGIALGTGQTFAAVVKHGAERLECVELNREVVAMSRKWFGEFNDHVLDDPRVRVHIDDGRAYLRGDDELADLIIMEPLQSWSAGTANLYSREFYREAKARLRRGGVLAQWIPFYGQNVEDTRAMVRSAAEEFETASLWLDSLEGILVLHDGPFEQRLSDLEVRAQRRGVSPALAEAGLGGAHDVAALLMLGPRGVRRWTEGALLLEDDRPWLEFTAARQFAGRSSAATDILRSMLIASEDDVMEYFADSQTRGSTTARHARAVRAVVRDIDLPAPIDERLQRLEALIGEVPTSTLARARYRGLVFEAANTTSTQDQSALLGLFERAFSHDSGFGAAAIIAGRIRLSRGEVDAARALLTRASMVDAVAEDARRLLSSIPSAPLDPR